MTRRQVALVAGASGLVGYRLARTLAETNNWEVVAMARRPPRTRAGFRSIPVDLTDIDDCRNKLSHLPQVTHLFYAAKYNAPRNYSTPEGESININVSMLENLLEALDSKARSLKHIHLVHGNSYYGRNNHRKTPTKEDDPRWLNSHFYYAQQDLISARQKGKRWNWSISRPQGVCDHLPHIARSIPLGIAVYASLSKALGIPLCFPGNVENYTAIQQCTDASHLAKAIIWIATNEQCANEAFNVTNGDYFRWENIWPKLAHFFDMPVGPLRETELRKVMKDQVPSWASLVTLHKLRKVPLSELVIWPYLERIFSSRHDQMADLTKLRKFGFHDIVDTEEMLLQFFRIYRRARIIP